MKTWIQHIMFLRNDKQKVVTDSYPYLCVHGILGGSVECLYVQMLLYPLYITIEKYTIFQLKSIPVLIVCEDKKSYLNAG